MKRTHNSLVLELVADGQPHSHHELYELHVVGHSRVSDLRKLGYAIRTWESKDERGERVYLYELQRVPDVAPAIERTLGERARGDLEVLRRTRGNRYPTERVEATTTPEGAGGWEQPRHPERNGEGAHRQERGADGPSEGVRAETRRESSAAGGIPGSAPTADEQSVLFDAPPGGGSVPLPEREYQSSRAAAWRKKCEVELLAVEQELVAMQEWGEADEERRVRLEERVCVLRDRLLEAAA